MSYQYLCEPKNNTQLATPLYNMGVRLNFASAVEPGKTDDITFDFDNLIDGKDAVIQDSLVNIGTRQGSNKLNEDEGTTLQEDTLNYALVNDTYLKHSCNFAASDTKFFENNYIGELNIKLADYFSESQTTLESSIVPNIEYVKSITELNVQPNKNKYDNAVLTVQFTFSDGTVVGDLDILTNF